jgi:hypothetical protein
MRRLRWLWLFLLPLQAFAANHYVRTGAAGSATGADWTNACTDFTGSCAVASLVRGDTYYVGTGAYANRTFSTADSSTLVITIKGATVADHGTSTGWSDAFSVSAADGGTQATWGTLLFTSDYWIWDGNAGPNFDQTPADYGFSFGTNAGNGTVTIGISGSPGSCGPTFTDIKLSHFFTQAPSGDVEKEWLQGVPYGGEQDSITISHFLTNLYQGLLMTRASACNFTSDTNWIIEYGVSLNNYSSTGGGTNNNHGEWIDTNERSMSGTIIRYNYVSGFSNPTNPTGGPANGTGFSGNGSTATIVGNNAKLIGSFIYGNVFNNVFNGNGTISDTTPNGNGDIQANTVVNNTFTYNYTADATILQSNNTNSTGNLAYNNIFYNLDLGGNSALNLSFQTHDYNTYLGTYGSTPTEAHKATGTANPFVNVNSDTWAGYALASDTTAGLAVTSWSTLPSGCTVGVNCMNVDANGVVRGANGTIDRGALQIAGGNPQAASPSFSPGAGSYIGSQSVTITSSSGGAIICYNTTGSPATNGTTGCTAGTLYSGPVTVSVNSTLFAVSGGTGFTDSTVASANYNFTVPPQNGAGSSLSAISH